MHFPLTLVLATAASAAAQASCPKYTDYAGQRHAPFSSGKYQFPYQRPAEECRSYMVPEVEQTIKDMSKTIKDQDLYRLFVNTWPNTVDTTVLWKGFAADDPKEEVGRPITPPHQMREKSQKNTINKSRNAKNLYY